MFSISNKHEEFFDYLIENAENFHRGTLIAKEVMANTANISRYIDREDFYKLTCQLEDCIDLLHGSLMRISLYHIETMTPAAIDIVDQLELMGKELKDIFSLLKNIDKNEAELMERANRLSKIETEVDNIYRREISRIFNGEMDLLDIIRWKDVLGTLEDTSDEVEELGNIIKEVTMKYA